MQSAKLRPVCGSHRPLLPSLFPAFLGKTSFLKHLNIVEKQLIFITFIHVARVDDERQTGRQTETLPDRRRKRQLDLPGDRQRGRDRKSTLWEATLQFEAVSSSKDPDRKYKQLTTHREW